MHFVDEENDISGTAHLDQNVPNAFFELTTVFCSGDQACDIQHIKMLVAQTIRNGTGSDCLRHALHNGGFADTRLTDERGIVFLLARQDPQHGFNFLLPSDNASGRGRSCHQIHAELIQQSGILHGLLLSGALTLVEIGKQKIGIDPTSGKQCACAVFAVAQHGAQKTLRLNGTFLICRQ